MIGGLVSGDCAEGWRRRARVGELARLQLFEGVDDVGVELTTPQPMALGNSLVDGPGRLVGPLVGERVERRRRRRRFVRRWGCSSL